MRLFRHYRVHPMVEVQEPHSTAPAPPNPGIDMEVQDDRPETPVETPVACEGTKRNLWKVGSLFKCPKGHAKSTSGHQQQLNTRPSDEAPVEAGEENKEIEKVEEKNRKKWWRKIFRFQKSSSKREQQKSQAHEPEEDKKEALTFEEQENEKLRTAVSSDDSSLTSREKLLLRTYLNCRTNSEELDNHANDESPVEAAEENKEIEKVEKKKEKKKWWRRFLKRAKPEQLNSEDHKCQDSPRWTPRSSDDYIFSQYVLGKKLGAGGFGVVYEARRLVDNLQVAVKYVNKKGDDWELWDDQHSRMLPLEIVLTLMANKGCKEPGIIQLLDWKVYRDHFIMIFEYPAPCQDLEVFVRNQGGKVSESFARPVMTQIMQAALVCCQRGVFHRDIKLSNLLINTETFQVKLIDFGCGAILKKSYYRTFSGTFLYIPPEYIFEGKYHANPATAWSLGILLFRLVCGRYPFFLPLLWIRWKIWCRCDLSNELIHLLHDLLEINPDKRIHLEDILQHSWFKASK
ncbi:serine/threonine-protein kinase pim-1 [Danio rerio]|uniref:Serine/threonine-protein kinase pim-1 n=1 Tax=Danio rerio TaxID=7955 RepID=A0AB32TVX4_DANRE